MKKVTRCKDCDNRVIDLGVGFSSTPKLICSQMCIEVEEDDGCTFGLKGDGGYAVRELDVTIQGREAVNGWYEEE